MASVTRGLLFVVGFSCLASLAVAQELPRWKFAEGDRLRYEVTQQTELEVEAGKAGDTSSFVMQTLDVVWFVDKVDENGTMTGTQRVERIRLEMRQPSGMEIEYDSAAETGAEGRAAMLSPLFDVLLATEVPITVTSAGEVTRCELGEKTVKQIASMPATKSMREYAAAEGLQAIAKQIALPLPAAEGESAKRKIDMTLAVLGTLEGEVVWTAEANEEGPLQFKPTLTLAIDASQVPEEIEGFAQPKPLQNASIRSQELTGEAQFDAEAGRLESSDFDLQLEIVGQLFDNEVTNHLRQLITVKRKQ
ncbi:hypothetical protein [Aeoliella mucimassa]|uniref:Uncharacterized protein n=1 Tax=Aeoliella mucimassa TaxID=2527972 RepID=A0A518AMM0_9BACT|nr:hypothetical protein [Aeoliella mucimassa]QDU55968.1 hypothetical protein Pan181_21700 [Aeoliella mucimassa]